MRQSNKQVNNAVRTIVVAAVASQFRRARIVESVVNKAKSLDLVASGNLINPLESKSIIPSADDLWLVPRKGQKRAVSVMTYGSKLSGEFFPALIKIRIDLGDYGIANKYESLATFAPNRGSDGSLGNQKEDMVDRIVNWIRYKSERGSSFFYTNRLGEREALSSDDRVNIQRVAYPIIMKLRRDGPDKKDFASAFNRVGRVLQLAEEKIGQSVYINVMGPSVSTQLDKIF